MQTTVDIDQKTQQLRQHIVQLQTRQETLDDELAANFSDRLLREAQTIPGKIEAARRTLETLQAQRREAEIVELKERHRKAKARGQELDKEITTLRADLVKHESCIKELEKTLAFKSELYSDQRRIWQEARIKLAQEYKVEL